MGQYTSYYLYEKYEVMGRNAYALDIYSINADGTMNPVVKSDNDLACGGYITRWVETEGTICDEVEERWVKTDDTVCEEITPVEPIYEWEKSDETLCVEFIPPFEGKYKLTLSDSSTVTAACDSTSAITRSEMSAHSNTCIVQIGDCVTSIDDFACYPLDDYLSSVTIGNNVTSIGSYAFFDCSNLTSITIPDSVTSIGDSAFEYCHSLSSITIGSGLTTIDINAFSYCDSLTNVNFPDSVTTIGNQFLEGCHSLTSCTIGSGVTSIGTWAFAYCSGLTSVIINATTPPSLGGASFRNTNNSFIIYVPSASVNAYKSASEWSSYSSRIQAIPII